MFPADLCVIKNAFFRCRRLTRVVSRRRACSIGDDAFGRYGYHRVPATLESLGDNVADDTKVTFAGTMRVSPSHRGILEIDREGGLYRNGDDGKRFVRLLDDEATRHGAIGNGGNRAACLHAARISGRLCARGSAAHRGDAAFRDCHELIIADFPSTLEEVGDEAFLDTSLARLHSPQPQAPRQYRARDARCP